MSNRQSWFSFATFTATSIPYQLVTQEFLSAVKERVADGGVVCANLWDELSEYPDMLKTYSVVFPELHALKCANSGNLDLVAFAKPAALTVQSWVEKSEAFEKKHPSGLDLPSLIRRGAAETTVIPAYAKVLLDKDKQGPEAIARSAPPGFQFLLMNLFCRRCAPD